MTPQIIVNFICLLIYPPLPPLPSYPMFDIPVPVSMTTPSLFNKLKHQLKTSEILV